MVGIGIQDHEQPLSDFPALEDGNHLRWSFTPGVGFPQHGYYLFRREHIGRDIRIRRLTEQFSDLTPGTESSPVITNTDRGDVILDSPAPLTFTDAYILEDDSSFSPGQDNLVELQLDGAEIELSLPMAAFAVTVLIDPDDSATITAYGTEDPTDEESRVPVDTARTDTAGPETVAFDAIDTITIEGNGTIIDIQYHLVADTFGYGWRPVPGLDGPITLPLSHPDYLANQAIDLTVDTDRDTATDRIAYGDSASYTTQTETIQTGQATVTQGSALVTTTGSFEEDITGAVFRVTGHDATYGIVTRINSTTLSLTRPYRGDDATAPYEIAVDDFGALHDTLATLVDEGPTAGGMANRIQPLPLTEDGDITATTGERTVTGNNTDWSSDLEGATFYAGAEDSDNVSVDPGDIHVIHDVAIQSDSSWGTHLAGATLRFAGQRTAYTVTEAYPGVLFIDRPYNGPALTGSDYTILESTGYEIDAVESATELTLSSPYHGPGSAGSYAIETPLGEGGGDAPTIARHQPLQSVLLAALSPAIAQALGLYWIDSDATPGTAYDYLIIADHGGTVERFAEEPRGEGTLDLSMFGPDGTQAHSTDTYIVYDVDAGNTAPLRQPDRPRVYDLPPRPPGDGTGPRNVAGINWTHPTASNGRTLPGEPVRYHLWRHTYGEDEPAQAAPQSAFDPITILPSGEGGQRDPLLPGGHTANQPADWPDTPIHALDGSRPDGWYGYRLTGVDVFGRTTRQSDDAVWFTPDTTTINHPYAIELRDEVAPPPPRAITATQTDQAAVPDAGNGAMTVRWLWPTRFQEQAPDTTEFHIQYHPGQFGELSGTIESVSESGDTITVATEIPPLSPDPDSELDPGDGYAGASLHVDETSFLITDSQADSNGLVLSVIDTRAPELETLETADGPVDIVTASGYGASDTESKRGEELASNVACTVSIPAFYGIGTVTVTGGDSLVIGHNTDWPSDLVGQTFTTPDGGTYEVETVIDAVHLELSEPYRTPDGSSNIRTDIAYGITHPNHPNKESSDAWHHSDLPANWEAQWATVDIAEGDEIDPEGNGPNPYPGEEETYKLFETTVPVPAAADPTTDPFVPTDSSPVAYANVGVTAIDEHGNESRVAGPATIVQRKTDPPPSPEAPDFEDEVLWATGPDYEGKAHFTVRWKHPKEECSTHVYRALDKALFKRDWETRLKEDDDVIEDYPKSVYPSGVRDDENARNAIVATLKDLHTTVSDQETFPEALPEYLALDTVVKQTIAALPENIAAYQQRTTESLTPTDELAKNRPGPDLEPGEEYPNGERWCAYVDSFDGKTHRQFFYRTRTVDSAGNLSDELTDPTPPVQAENTIPPVAPTPQSILGGDREITIEWATNPESALAEYHIYRTTDESHATDIRRMVKVHTEPAGDAQTVTWTDNDPPVLTSVHYRLVAVDDAGNTSTPSTVIVGRAIDTAPPEPPTPTVSWSDADTHVEITWTSEDETILQRRSGDVGPWTSLTDWTESGDHSITDNDPDPTAGYDYRLRARKPDTGAIAVSDTATLSPQ